MSEQHWEGPTVGDYSIGKTIGKGTFGKVKLGVHNLTNEKVRDRLIQVAIKILEKSRIQEQADNVRVGREIQILRSIRHPNIIQLYEIISTPTKLFLIMEYAEGGELFELIVKNQRQLSAARRLDQFQASKYLQQILNAVEYLHRMGIAHRDLKPQNLLLDHKHNIKVVDFGLSNLYSEPNQLATACGSPCYAAPEMISGHLYDGMRTDMWSCGIILYAMICGYLPFEDPDTAELYRKIKLGEFEIPNFVSLTARDLMLKMMHTDPLRRATIEAVRKHNFCMKKEPPVKGIVPGEHNIEPEARLLEQLSQHRMEPAEVRQELINNKHNRQTSTYYLMLKQWLTAENRTLLDYFQAKQKEAPAPMSERVPILIRKRKLQNMEKTPSKQIRPSTREMLSLNSKEIGRRVSQQLTKHSSKALSQANSRNNFRSPLAKLTDRPLHHPNKRLDGSEQTRPLRSRVRMKSEIDNGAMKKPRHDVRRLVEIIDRRLSRLNIHVDKVGRPFVLMPQGPKPAVPVSSLLENNYLNTEEDTMLQRIYRKNIEKLHGSPGRRRSKSKPS